MRQFPAKRLLRAYLVLLFVVAVGMVYRARPVRPETAVAAEVQQTLPEITFVENEPYTVDEGDVNVDIRVRLSFAYTETVTVSFATADGSAKVSDDDYLSTSGTLNFSSSLTRTITVAIQEDDVYEPGDDEFFYISLSNPSNATIPDTLFRIEIDDDDQAPANTPTPVSTRIFADAYEPNNTFGEAFTIVADAGKIQNVTLWPTGDEDFFRWVGKEDSAYRVSTSELSGGLDTELFVYDTQGNLLGQNDDTETGPIGNRSSSVRIVAEETGYYYARVINRDPSNPADKTYSIEVVEVEPPTPTPSQTPVPGADVCEFNSTVETACVLDVGAGNGFTGQSFVPTLGSARDTDFYKLWMRAGSNYTCETFVNAYADTNMIFLDQNANDFQPNLGNNDKEPGDYGSKLSLWAPYTGWLYIMVGPVVAPPYEESNLHQYDIECIAVVATSTPTPTATPTAGPIIFPTATTAATSTPTGPTATPIVFPTFPATATPVDFSFLTPSPTPTPPIIQIQPLPTATAVGGGQQNVSINVTLYYDSNFNYLPELNEGIMDVAVTMYDNATGSLIAFGSTNEAGTVSFTSIASSGAVRVVVPFLNYSQVVVGGSSNILLRVAPQPLPIGIP